MTSQEIVDKVYLGSSPIILLDAASSAFQKEKVLLLEKQRKLGGPWRSLSLQSVGEIESSSHIFEPSGSKENDLMAIDFLSQLGIQVEQVEGPKVKILGSTVSQRSSTVSQRSSLGDALVGFYETFFGQWKQLIVDIRSGISLSKLKAFLSNYLFYLSLFGRGVFHSLIFKYRPYLKYHYPTQGIKDVLNRAINIIEENEGKISTEEHITEVHIKKDWVLVKTSEEREYNARKIVLPSFFEIEGLFYRDKRVSTPSLKREIFHLTMVLEGRIKGKFQFLRLWKNSLIHRVSNSSRLCQIDEDKFSVLQIQINSNPFENEERSLNNIYNELVRQKIIFPDQKLIEHRFIKDVSSFRKIKQVEEISQSCEGRIEILDTAHIFSSIGKYAKKWERLASN
jgi:hypothetical protein